MNVAGLNIFDGLTSKELASHFSVVLRQWLTVPEITEINSINAVGGYDASTCASHDYCDANMAMLEAVSNAIGVPVDDIDVSDPGFCELVNTAWAIAKRVDFDPLRLSAP